MNYPRNLCLGLKRQRGLVGRCLVKNSYMSPGLLFGAWCCVLPRVSQHRYGAIREETLLLLTDGRVWCVCVCGVCISGHIWVRILVCGGKGSGVWGGRGGGEVWGEVSGGTAGETPTPTSCCLR